MVPMANIEVRRSLIEGLGIFAVRPFRAGERIATIRIVRQITLQAPIREDLGERNDHCAYPDGKVVLIAFPERHVNHSCDPNAYEYFEGDTSFLVARRYIAADEEIGVDYNINITNGTAWPCHCGATRCTGEVAGDFFRLPVERQREYRPLLADWFIRHHHSRIDALDSVCDGVSSPVGTD
jgi:uncharacterized protein